MNTEMPAGKLAAPEPGVLRAYRAEAARRERLRLLHVLRVAAGGAGRDGSRGSYRAAVQLLESHSDSDLHDPDSGPGALWASVTGGCDSVELYKYDEPTDGVPETEPVRVVVVDGADSLVANAFLSLDDAEKIFQDGLALVQKIRNDRAASTT